MNHIEGPLKINQFGARYAPHKPVCSYYKRKIIEHYTRGDTWSRISKELGVTTDSIWRALQEQQRLGYIAPCRLKRVFASDVRWMMIDLKRDHPDWTSARIRENLLMVFPECTDIVPHFSTILRVLARQDTVARQDFGLVLTDCHFSCRVFHFNIPEPTPLSYTVSVDLGMDNRWEIRVN